MKDVNPYKVLTVIGARPQFVKAAIVSKALSANEFQGRIEEIIVHTGQHYDENLSDIFFKELSLRRPDFQLSSGSTLPGEQLGAMVSRLEPLMIDLRPDAVLVYGDTNSTFAACIAANQYNIPLIHVEAGERIYRRFEVPEERIRVATDHLSDLCLTCTAKAQLSLSQEGISQQRIRVVGDPMWDLFLWGKCQLPQASVRSLSAFGVESQSYVLATIHRAENTHLERVEALLAAFGEANLPVVLPAHPRLKKIIDQLNAPLPKNIKVIEPVGYFDFLNLLLNCDRVVTDSGGVSREAFFAKKYAIIPMKNSWWTEIVEAGWAVCTGVNSDALVHHINDGIPSVHYPAGVFGDGQSSQKIWRAVIDFLAARQPEGYWHRHGSISNVPRVEATDFCYTAYRNIIQQFRAKNYEFRAFNDPRNSDCEARFVLLRHDIDFCLHKALAMAKVEQQLGVKATYFFMLSSPFYNLFSAHDRAVAAQILSLGHRLGLHFDWAAYPNVDDVAAINTLVTNEVSILQAALDKPVDIVSFHRPNQLVMTGDPNCTAPLDHTYMEKYVKSIEYCSDSRGKWAYGAPIERTAFQSGKPIHLLIHPIWWDEIARSSVSTLEYFLKNRQEHLEREMALNCAPYSFLLNADIQNDLEGD